MKLGKRYIRFYDHTLGNIPISKKPAYEPPTLKSHYERISVKEPFYFYVKKKEPSDIEGSLLVGEDEVIKMGINPNFPTGIRDRP